MVVMQPARHTTNNFPVLSNRSQLFSRKNAIKAKMFCYILADFLAKKYRFFQFVSIKYRLKKEFFMKRAFLGFIFSLKISWFMQIRWQWERLKSKTKRKFQPKIPPKRGILHKKSISKSYFSYFLVLVLWEN